MSLMTKEPCFFCKYTLSQVHTGVILRGYQGNTTTGKGMFCLLLHLDSMIKLASEVKHGL